MIYDKNLATSYDFNPSFGITGAVRIYLAPHTAISSYTITNKQISQFDYTGDWSVYDNLQDLQYQNKSEKAKSGILYNVQITFVIPSLRADHNYILDEILQNNTVCILEDANGRFWFFGYQQGLIGNYSATSNNDAYEVNISCKQFAQVEEVAPALVRSLTIKPLSDNTTPIPNVFAVIPTLNSTTNTSANIQKSVTVSSNNYTIKQDEGVIFVTATSSLTLPSNPVSGQEHTIVATYAASDAAPVNINGIIDNTAGFKINTDCGSITLVFRSGSGWYTKAFTA